MSDLTTLKLMAANAKVKRILDQSHFSICELDTLISEMKTCPDPEAYSVLRMLHYVHYDKMPAELRNRVPSLIAACLSEAKFQMVPDLPVVARSEPPLLRPLRLIAARD